EHLQRDVGPGAGLLAPLRPLGEGTGAGPPRRRVRRGGARVRYEPLASDVPPRAPQRPHSGGRHRHLRHPRGHPGERRPRLPRAGGAAADARVGRDDRRGQGLHPPRPEPHPLAGLGDHGRRPRLQLRGRRPTRRLRPQRQGKVSMTAELEAALARVPDYDRFYTFAEMLDSAHGVAASHPDLVSIERVGSSTEGRPIEMVRIGDGPQRLLLYALPHPNEPIGAVLVQFLLEELVANEALRRGRSWYLLPCVDPDGTVLNEGWFAGPFTVRNYA